jgi:dienelactone hydrolase
MRFKFALYEDRLRLAAVVAAAMAILACVSPAVAQVAPEQAVFYFDAATNRVTLAAGAETRQWPDNVSRDEKGHLEFTTTRQTAHLDGGGLATASRALREAGALSIGGWFFCRRAGEQVLFGRGEAEIAPLGERILRPSDRFINFCLGTDHHGFFMGAINGNGTMPFVHVTVNQVPIQSWQQLVVVKDAEGFHHFYQNGQRVHDDRRSMHAPSSQPWRETDAGLQEPIHLQAPQGGLIAETWIVGRALTAEEIARDYEAKRARFTPSPPGQTIALQDIDAHWPAEPFSFDRQRVTQGVLELLGPFPQEKAPLAPQLLSEEDCGSYLRRKVSIQVQPGDRMPAWLLVPKDLQGPAPAVVCFYGTTSGAGKDVTAGISGRKPGTPPVRNMSFALDMVEAGFVALAPDYLRDGERIRPGDSPYHTARFYEEFPHWSIHGKDTWDTMRAIDYLQSLDFVDGERIGMAGHSYGGHSTIFAAALEPRIKVAVANGPVSAFREHGMHWAVPPGAGASQSLPAMRKYILNPELPLPATFAEWTALIAPRPLLVGQAVGERRPIEEENCGYVKRVYQSAHANDKVRYVWYAGDHDFPPEARAAAVAWFRRWFDAPAN